MPEAGAAGLPKVAPPPAKDAAASWQPPAPPRDTDLDVDAVPRGGAVAAGKDSPKAKRVKELPGKRSANGKVFELSDGRLEQELSVAPVHYRGKDRAWRQIDTAVKAVTGERGYSLGNRANRFSSFFGADRDSLVLFRDGEAEVSLGLPQADGGGAARLKPVVDGNRVTYRDVVAPGVDLSYAVTPDGLKEDIVIREVPEVLSGTSPCARRVSWHSSARTGRSPSTAAGSGARRRSSSLGRSCSTARRTAVR